MNRRALLAGLCLMPFAASVKAAQIGTNTPFPPLSLERINALPAPERKAWAAYLKRSQTQMAADKAVLRAERQGLKDIPAAPAEGNGEKTMPMDKPAEWYGSDEAKVVTANVISFQTPAVLS